MRGMSALVIASVSCAAAPPCPPLRTAPRAVLMTDFEGCARRHAEGAPSVIRYPAWSRDSVRHPDLIIIGDRTAICEPSAIARGPRGEIFVLNHAPTNDRRIPGQTPSTSRHWTSWVTVYDSVAAGDAVPVRILRIYTPGLSHPTGIAVDRVGYLYVLSEVNFQQDSGSVMVFDRGADGNIAPLRVLAGPTTGLRRPQGLAVDRHGYLYVFNPPDRNLADTVLVFAPGASGDTGPCRILGGEPTGTANPVAVAVDRRSRLYVASIAAGNSVRVFDATASGAPPLRRIVGSPDWMLDGMYSPNRLAIGAGDSLYVRSIRNLSVYAPTDTLGPSRTFFYNAPEIFALGRQDTLYAWSAETVKVYPPGYTGAGHAVRTLNVAGARLRGPPAMAVDSRGWLYLLDSASSRILAYAPGASGDTPPARTVAGSRTRLSRPTAIALDDSDRLYVTNGPRTERGGAIRVFAPRAKGEDKPVRVLRGPDTGLLGPAAVAFGRGGEMYVSQAIGDSSGLVATYRREAEGNEAPLARLTGPRTGLRSPTIVAFGAADTMYVLNPVGRSICTMFGWSPAPEPARVTVYAPGAEGNAAPVRTLAATGGGLEQPFAAGLIELGLAVDAAGRVQVWHTGGSFIYAAGAEDMATPAHAIREVAPKGTELTAVGIGRGGWVYQTRVPRRPLAGSCR